MSALQFRLCAGSQQVHNTASMSSPTTALAPSYWLVVPTYNPGAEVWSRWIAALAQQTHPPQQVFVVDSSSTDGTPALSRAAGFKVFTVAPDQFNHGGTRQWALDQALAQQATTPSFVVYLTQDAILAQPKAIHQLLSSFQDPHVAAAFGRQIPHSQAPWLEAHARHYNYPDTSRTVSLQDKHTLGLKVCFFSDAFAAYRLDTLQQQGGFPKHVPLGEDTFVAGKLLLSGHSLRYEALAAVYHSHQYNGLQDFQRMFDTGVFHAQNPWLQASFGSAEGEGLRYTRAQLHYLQTHKSSVSVVLGFAHLMVRNAIKWLGYRLGKAHTFLPRSLKRAMAMHKPYWSTVSSHQQA